MKLFTQKIIDEMAENSVASGKDPNFSPRPVVKIFDPSGAATWLLSELDTTGEEDLLFGLCDLGMGFPEMGNVLRSDLENYRGVLGIGLERDLYFKPDKTLREYAAQAREAGRIVT